jgi:hypothetical protein
MAKPQSTAAAIRDTFKTSGVFGLYTDFYLHFRERASSLGHPRETVDMPP